MKYCISIDRKGDIYPLYFRIKLQSFRAYLGNLGDDICRDKD